MTNNDLILTSVADLRRMADEARRDARRLVWTNFAEFCRLVDFALRIDQHLTWRLR